MENIFYIRDRVFNFSRLRVAYFIIFIATFLLTEFGREVYRPIIGFADMIGNLLGTITVIFLEIGIAHATKKQAFRIIAFVTTGVTIYELLQPILPRGVMDWKDVVATPVAGLIALLLLFLLYRFIPDMDPLSVQSELETK